MDDTQKKRLMKEHKMPIADAWALVAYADRINSGRYVKEPELDRETGNVVARPNRSLIADQITLGMMGVTDADRSMGVQMESHFQGLAFSLLTKQSDFDSKILGFTTQGEIDASAMAYMACMGARYHREIAKEFKDELLQRVASTSTHTGAIGHYVRLNVKVISKFEGKVFNGSVVRATDGTNIYFWTSSYTVDMWPDSPEEFPIVAVIKAHGHDRDGYAETRLTKVKITMK
jgi:hypothetical protein